MTGHIFENLVMFANNPINFLTKVELHEVKIPTKKACPPFFKNRVRIIRQDRFTALSTEVTIQNLITWE